MPRNSAQVKSSGRMCEYSDGYIAGSCSCGGAPTHTTGMPCAACQSRRISAPLSILPGYVQRTVINNKIGGSLAYPLLPSNSQSLMGTVSACASHDEDDYHNTINGAQIGLRSQIRVLQVRSEEHTSELQSP